MDQLHQLSAQYNALWIETNQLYETWARQRGMSLYELLVILSIAPKRHLPAVCDPQADRQCDYQNADRQGMAGAQGLGAGPQKQETFSDSRGERTGGADRPGASGARGTGLAPAGTGPGGTVD